MTLDQYFKWKFTNFFENNFEELLKKASKIEIREGKVDSPEEMIMLIFENIASTCYSEIFQWGKLVGFDQDMLDTETEVDEIQKEKFIKVIDAFFYAYRNLFGEILPTIYSLINYYDKIEQNYLLEIQRNNQSNFDSLSKKVNSLISKRAEQQKSKKLSDSSIEDLELLVKNTIKQIIAEGKKVTKYGIFTRLKDEGYELSQNTLERKLGDSYNKLIENS